MCLEWTAAGTLEAERQFRKIIGYARRPLHGDRDILSLGEPGSRGVQSRQADELRQELPR